MSSALFWVAQKKQQENKNDFSPDFVEIATSLRAHFLKFFPTFFFKICFFQHFFFKIFFFPKIFFSPLHTYVYGLFN